MDDGAVLEIGDEQVRCDGRVETRIRARGGMEAGTLRDRKCPIAAARPPAGWLLL
jgi:hypothetical protein